MNNSANENNKNNFNDSSAISTHGIGPLSKKRKISEAEMSSSTIELEILQFANEKLKKYVKKLESEKNLDGCHEEKILELKNVVSNLKAMNAEFKAKNEEEKNQHKNEMDSIINEYTKKIKSLEDEKQEFESKIKELNDEIATMKTIKSEIKDSVEKERENVQNETAKLKAEMTDVKEENRFLSEANQNLLKIHKNEIQNLKLEKERAEAKLEEERKSFQSTISEYENQRKKIEKKYGETAVANQQLEQKCKNLETTINKNKKEYQSKINALKEKFNNESEMQIVSLEDAFLGGKINDDLVSCKSNIIINVSKLDGSDGSWKLYSTVNHSESHSLTAENLCKSCFKLNITDQLLVSDTKLHYIMHKINTCQLTKLHIAWQTINYVDYQKLVSSKKVEICVLEYLTVKHECRKECNLDDLLKHLPNIKEFTYKFFNIESITYNHPTLAKNLGQLEPFFHLQKFEILNLTSKFKIEDFNTFINKQNKDVTYTFKFWNVLYKSAQKEIEKAKNRLLKSLSFPCKLQLGFEKD